MQSTTLYSGLAVLLVTACAEPPALMQPIPAADSGASPADSGKVAADSGAFDAGMIEDAQSAAPDAGPTPDPDSGVIADAGTLGERCFPEIFDPNFSGPDYDQFNPVYGSHCFGTNQQDITNIERVVFLGDSVTVGTPPTPHESYYRALLADRLAAHFALEPPSDGWKRASLVNGTSLIRESGDFTSCAKWGARTDDLLEDNNQLEDCFPVDQRSQRTLVIMTIGGNDIAALTKDGAPSGGKTVEEVTADAAAFVRKLREAAQWIKDPTRFPHGVDLVFANMFEFTDATGDVASCPAAAVAGFDEPWDDQQALEDLVVWANEQFMAIAVETGSDLIFMLEHFCGHGYHHDDPASRCYRGPETERWFDVSCIHPNPIGHQVITEMFMAIVDE